MVSKFQLELHGHFLQSNTGSSATSENQAVGVETLKVKNILKNKRLSKALSDAGIGMLYAMLEYKLKAQGKPFVKIDPWFPSTKLCYTCKSLREMSLQEQVYSCACGWQAFRDYNAALNIREETLQLLSATGHVVVMRGDDVIPTGKQWLSPMKRNEALF